MKQKMILLFALLLPISAFSAVNAQESNTGTLMLSKFEVSDIVGDDIVIKGRNEAGNYETLRINPQKPFTIAIYDDEINYTGPDIPPPIVPLPILPPPDHQIYIELQRSTLNVGLRIDSGSQTIEILNGQTGFGLFSTIEALQQIDLIGFIPFFEFFETSEEFGYTINREDEFEYVKPDGSTENQTILTYREFRYSKESGLLTFMQIDDGFANYECCGPEKHFIIDSNIAESPLIIEFNGFLIFPLAFLCLIPLKKRVNASRSPESRNQRS